MQPEISRRCLGCGASPRAGARFCPQCGSGLDERGRGEEAPSPDVQPETRDVAREEAAGGGEEVARAFDAWRGGAASVGDVARALTGDEVKSPGSAPPPAGEAAPAPPAEEASRPAPPAADEMAKTRRPVMPEPPAAKDAPAVDEAEGEASSAAKLAGAVGATRRRAASVVKESIAPRVERVRDRSLVMMEEAPDDSGLRFVLLAALMFALFILLLVLNTVIK